MEITDTQSFLTYYKRIRQRTLRVVKCIPEDKFDWSYKPGKFSFADLLRHLAAAERYMFGENVQLQPSRYPGHGPELADGYENVLAYFNRMHSETVSIIQQLSDDDLQKKCVTPGGIEITVWKWLRAMVEHEIHHRGQIYSYLAILNVPTPPLYGLTSEEVFANSER